MFSVNSMLPYRRFYVKENWKGNEESGEEKCGKNKSNTIFLYLKL